MLEKAWQGGSTEGRYYPCQFHIAAWRLPPSGATGLDSTGLEQSYDWAGLSSFPSDRKYRVSRQSALACQCLP